MPQINSFTRIGVVENTPNTEAAPQSIAAVFDTTNWYNAVFAVRIRVVARQTNGINEGGLYRREAIFKRSAGVLSLIGAVQVIGTDVESVAGWDVTIDKGDVAVVATTTGNFIRVLVTGAIGDSVDWAVEADIQVNDGQFGQAAFGST